MGDLLLHQAADQLAFIDDGDQVEAALDALSARRGYHNRSEAVRDILRDALNQDPPSPESRRGYAV
ncbi:ribbon-helix-helix protein, CopG family, partial [Klebsiella pneumoniae]|uniref:ribbon-helix-helix protein, CopG family n=1 Tax=Klebsiella pneumoniae TaxID=573 RepID=UPI001298C33A